MEKEEEIAIEALNQIRLIPSAGYISINDWREAVWQPALELILSAIHRANESSSPTAATTGEKTDLVETFEQWVASLPKTHWAKYDLAACHLGWDAGQAALVATNHVLQNTILPDLVAIQDAFDDFEDEGRRGNLHGAGTVLGLAEKRLDELVIAIKRILSSHSNATGAAQVPETSAPKKEVYEPRVFFETSAPSSSVAEKKETDLGLPRAAHTKHEPTTD